MHCRICGEEERAEYYPSKRQALCRSCAGDTPRKMPRSTFDKRYWGRELSTVPEGTRREFYSDYLACSGSFARYVEDTTADHVA